MIHRTYLVSFPRSGHHWLVRMLQRYFGEELVYCDHYNQKDTRMDAGNLRTNLEKSHDLGLNLDTHGCQVIVLYRKDVAASMKSWRILWKSNLSDSDFASSKQDYWLRFLAKWTQPVQVGERRIVLTYCELMGNPVITLGEAIRFLGDKQPDTNRIIQAISAEKNWPLEFSRLHQTA